MISNNSIQLSSFFCFFFFVAADYFKHSTNFRHGKGLISNRFLQDFKTEKKNFLSTIRVSWRGDIALSISVDV